MRIRDWSSDVCSSDLAVKSSAPKQARAHRALDARSLRRSCSSCAPMTNSSSCVSIGSVAPHAMFSIWFMNSTRREPHCGRSEEHTSELQSLMRISYAVFCLKKKKYHQRERHSTIHKYIINIH